jgi:hypothetical protein
MRMSLGDDAHCRSPASNCSSRSAQGGCLAAVAQQTWSSARSEIPVIIATRRHPVIVIIGIVTVLTLSGHSSCLVDR